MKRRNLLLATVVVAGVGSGAAIHGNSQMVAPTVAVAVEGPVCEVTPNSIGLPDEVEETSGLALGRARPNVLWTHNDGGGAELYALDRDGQVLGQVMITGVTLDDWEDLGSGPCSDGHCLFIADTGDNDGEREQIAIYRVDEPVEGIETVNAIAMHLRYPDGKWDAEAIFVVPDGDIHLVTKGREGAVVLYRVPASAGPDSVATLERIRELFPATPANEDRITGGGISPDGLWVGIRSKSSLYFYPTQDLLDPDTPVEPTVIDLRPLGEPQGEALAIDADGTVWLTSEAENDDVEPLLSRIQCTFPA